jgi:hypothetical protein
MAVAGSSAAWSITLRSSRNDHPQSLYGERMMTEEEAKTKWCPAAKIPLGSLCIALRARVALSQTEAEEGKA